MAPSLDLQPASHNLQLPPVAPKNSTNIERSNDSHVSHVQTTIEGESNQGRLERLGRQRPKQFKTLLAELGFVFSVVMSQVLTEYFVSGSTVIIPTLIQDLHIPAASIVWPTGAYSLAVASTLLVFGRLSDIFGGRYVYIGGIAWYAAWSLVAGFSQNELMLDFCRAFQGLGSAAFLPSSLMLLGRVYRPGPRKNTIFGIYAAAAPLGFYAGIFFAGIAGQFAGWRWYFFIGAILAALTAITAWFSLPEDRVELKSSESKMDWLGSALIVSGLVLVVFALTDSAHAPQGWRTPYIYSLFVLGALLLLGAVYVEGWVAEQPLIPSALFKPKYMKPLFLALFFFYGGLGIIFLYATLYMHQVMGATPLQLVAWYTPAAVGGIVIATAGGLIMHRIPGTALALFAGVAWLGAPLLFALAPLGASYWAYAFPAMLCTTAGIDIMFNVTNVFITTSLPARWQGLAGGAVNALLQLGIAVFLGCADLIAVTGPQSEQGDGRVERLRVYRRVMWFGVGLAGVSLVIVAGFVRIGKAKGQMTVDELEEAAAAAAAGSSADEQP